MGFDTRRKSDKPVSCHCQILCPPVICESVNHRLHFFDPFSPNQGIKVCCTELVNPRLKVSHREISSLVARWQGFCTVIVVSTKLRNCGLLHMDGGNPLVMEQIILIGSLEGPEPERSQDAKDKVNTRVNAGHQFNIGIHHKEAFQVSSMETYFCTPPFFEFLSSLYLFSTCS